MGQRIERVKTHLRQNKKLYIGGLCGVGAGAVITLLIVKERNLSCLAVEGPSELPRSALGHVLSISQNSGTVIAQNSGPVIFGSYTRKIVQNMETGEIFDSVASAAESAGVTFSKMSRHINGHMEHVNGSTFRIIGLSAG